MNEDPGQTKFSNSLEATSQDYASKKDKSSIDRGPEKGARWAFGVAEGVRGLPPCDRVGDGASGEDDMPRGRGKGRGGGNDGFEAGADRVVGDGNAEECSTPAQSSPRPAAREEVEVAAARSEWSAVRSSRYRLTRQETRSSCAQGARWSCVVPEPQRVLSLPLPQLTREGGQPEPSSEPTVSRLEEMASVVSPPP